MNRTVVPARSKWRRRRAWVAALGALGALSLLSGCQTVKVVSETVAVVGVTMGAVTEEQAQSIVRTGEALGSAMEQLTPENEYWIGRASCRERVY